MGIVDCFSAEDRVQVKFSDFYNLMKQSAKQELTENAVKCRVPYEHITTMLTGENDLLKAYEDTGLTPDKIREIDEMYAEMSKTVATLKKQNAELSKIVVQASEADPPEKAAGDEATPTDTEKTPLPKSSKGGGHPEERN